MKPPVCQIQRLKMAKQQWSTYKGRLQNRRLTGGSVRLRRLSLFRTIETGWNRTKPPVNHRLSFEVVPKVLEIMSWFLNNSRTKT